MEKFPNRQITKLKIKGTLPKFCEKIRREIIVLSIKTKLKENKKKEEEGGRDFRNKIKRIRRISCLRVNKSLMMIGRILGKSSNKKEVFIAYTGTSVIILQ